MRPAGRALVLGAAGQDGVYLSRQLAADGVDVVGAVPSLAAAAALAGTYLAGIPLVELDVRDSAAFGRLVAEIQPTEIYNLAGRSSVRASWADPLGSLAVNGTAVVGMLEQLRQLPAGTARPRFLQAASSEMYGLAASSPQSLATAHHPRSPYGSAKSLAFHTVVNYREAHGLHCVNAVLFNHESPLRPEHFVTRKIARCAAEIAAGQRETVPLGNLDVRRDWGFAGEYVGAMRLILGADEPRDHVVATGRSHSLLDFTAAAMQAAGVADWQERLVVDPALQRPADVPETCGDPEPLARTLGWRAHLGMADVAARMVKVELARMATGEAESLAYL